MGQKTVLHVPEAKGQTALYSKYFAEVGLSAQTVLEAVSLTYQRSDVSIGDALAVFEEQGSFKAACAAGCGYCCHTQVSVIPPEAFHVAHYLETAFEDEERAELKQRVRDNDAEYRGADGARRYAERAACPFLDGESWNCRLHAGRPTACRAMHSGSLPACKAAFENRDPTVPAPSMKAFFDNRDATYAGWASALRRHGLSMAPIELNAALVTIWDGEDVMGRWLKGEDVFAEIA